MIIFTVTSLIVRIAAGTFVIFWGENLFWASLGIYLLGNTLIWSWPDPRLANMQAALRMPPVRAARVGAALYVLAAVLMAVGAAIRLHPVLAAFVIILSAAWFFFGFFLRWFAAEAPKTWPP